MWTALQHAVRLPRMIAEIFYSIFRRINQAQGHISLSKGRDPRTLVHSEAEHCFDHCSHNPSRALR
jgi:hypothetical protein